MRLSRSRGQPVSTRSMKRPGRADITPMRSDSMRRLVERMGDQQHGGAGLAPELEQFVAHQQPRLLVERAERLVEQQQARPHHQRARDADPLAHAAGELRRIGSGKAAQAHEGERVLDALARLRVSARRRGASRTRRCRRR